MRIFTRPRRPSTMRTTSVRSPQIGMKSVSRTAPVDVVKVVSRTSESPRYRRVVRRVSCAGAISHRPCSGVPSSAQKHAASSKRGTQSQSMEPSRPTRAAVRRLPISA